MQDHKQHRHDRIIKTKPLNQHNNLNIHRIPTNTTCMITNRLDLDHERSSQDLTMKEQSRRYNHLATTWTHSQGGITQASYRREGLRDDLPSGRVPGRTSDPPRSRDDGGGYRRFRGYLIEYSGYLHRGLLIGEGGDRGGGQGLQTLARRGAGPTRAWGGSGPL